MGFKSYLLVNGNEINPWDLAFEGIWGAGTTWIGL